MRNAEGGPRLPTATRSLADVSGQLIAALAMILGRALDADGRRESALGLFLIGWAQGRRDRRGQR